MFAFSSVTLIETEDAITEMFNKDRAQSMLYRLVQEDKLLEKVALRPWFGWGGEGRGRIFNPRTGKNVSVVDGLWILTLSDRGFFGLAVLCAAFLLPAARFAWYYPANQWAHPGLAPAAVLALVLVLWMIDNLSNAMIDPLFILGAGALTSVTGVRLSTWGAPATASVLPPSDVARPFVPPRLSPGTETQRPGVLVRRRAGKIDSDGDSR
jgi:O-antigen ligase